MCTSNFKLASICNPRSIQVYRSLSAHVRRSRYSLAAARSAQGSFLYHYRNEPYLTTEMVRGYQRAKSLLITTLWTNEIYLLLLPPQDPLTRSLKHLFFRTGTRFYELMMIQLRAYFYLLVNWSSLGSVPNRCHQQWNLFSAHLH